MSDLQNLLKGKTPTSFLQEICSRKKLTPTFDVLANEGPIHEPVFVMRAQAGEFQGTGKGPSKKKAKHNAAEDLLCAMYGFQKDQAGANSDSLPTAGESQSSGLESSLPQMSTGMFDNDMQGNPIGELQEYTQKKVLRPPIYEYIGEEGPPHAREFVCTVKLGKLQETAVGKSKKIAKRAAASKLLQAVRQHQTDTSPNTMIDEDDDELPLVSMDLQQNSDSRLKSIQVLTKEGGKQATEFFERLKVSSKAPGSGRGIQYLHSANLNSPTENFVKVLEDLAKSSKFEVSYMDIKSKSYSGQYQCLVQVSSAPIAVCYGTGKSPDDARQCAAHNTLQYLRIMTNES